MALTFNPIPASYRKMSDQELTDRILTIKKQMGKKLVILTHHYQRKEIVALGDYRGDSYALSKIASELEAEIIAFCGVHFMAEAADVLSAEKLCLDPLNRFFFHPVFEKLAREVVHQAQRLFRYVSHDEARIVCALSFHLSCVDPRVSRIRASDHVTHLRIYWADDGIRIHQYLIASKSDYGSP